MNVFKLCKCRWVKFINAIEFTCKTRLMSTIIVMILFDITFWNEFKCHKKYQIFKNKVDVSYTETAKYIIFHTFLGLLSYKRQCLSLRKILNGQKLKTPLSWTEVYRLESVTPKFQDIMKFVQALQGLYWIFALRPS